MKITPPLPVNTLLCEGEFNLINVIGQEGNWINYSVENSESKKQLTLKEFCPPGCCIRTTNQQLSPLNSYSDEYELRKTTIVDQAKKYTQIKHPNILHPHTLFKENNSLYLAVALQGYKNINDFLQHNPRLSSKAGLDIILQIGSALEYMHDRHIIHGNVNPANIYVSESSMAKLWLMGDHSIPEYTAPELLTLEKPKSVVTDIYSLGACLYLLVTGQHPPIFNKNIKQTDFALSKISPSVAPIILKAMAPIAKDRYQSLDYFFEDLKRKKQDSALKVSLPPVLNVPVNTPVQSVEEEVKINLDIKLGPTLQEKPSIKKSGSPIKIPPVIPPKRRIREETPKKQSRPVNWFRWSLILLVALIGSFLYWLNAPVEPLPDLLKEKKENPANDPIVELSAAELTVRDFIKHLGQKELSEAYQLQKNPKWKDQANFNSSEKGFGGITKTKIYSTEKIYAKNNQAKVFIKYIAFDPSNDLEKINKFKRYCDEAGVIYDQYFFLEKIDKTWYITNSELIDSSCEGKNNY